MDKSQMKEITSKKDLKKVNAGATAIEYGLIASLIGVVIITAASKLGSSLSSTFSAVK